MQPAPGDQQFSTNPFLNDRNIVPARVGMAFNYIGCCEAMRIGVPNKFNGEPSGGRELTLREQVVYDAALSVLLEFFDGENDTSFSPAPFGPQPPPEPSIPVRVV